MRAWGQGLAARLRRALRWARSARWDLIWVAFVVANLAAMKLVPQWGTVPFLAIWVSLTVIYGFRLWRLQPAILTLTVVTLATGAIIGIEVINGQQDADYLAEVPLIALMFLVVVWHGRRRVSAVEGRLAAMEEVQRVSQENLRLLEQQRLFLLDAAHELGTPITVALGHAELIEQAATDELVAEDARVIVSELGRMRRLAVAPAAAADVGGIPWLPPPGAGGGRHGGDGSAQQVGLHAAPLAAGGSGRGDHPRRSRPARGGGGRAGGERRRAHGGRRPHRAQRAGRGRPGGARRDRLRLRHPRRGPGQDLQPVLACDPLTSRESGGFGLGLPVVAAIAEAHHGSVPGHQQRRPRLDVRVRGAHDRGDCERLGAIKGPFGKKLFIQNVRLRLPSSPPAARRSAGHRGRDPRPIPVRPSRGTLPPTGRDWPARNSPGWHRKPPRPPRSPNQPPAAPAVTRCLARWPPWTAPGPEPPEPE